MKRVEPKVFLIGETRVRHDGLKDYLDEIGTNFYPEPVSGSEVLTEVYGRLCYRSWEPGMNANVGKITEGNNKYIGNVLRQKHGALFEHSVVNFIFHNVSRVFCHELVRHRAGMAFSQESLRYVRLTDLGLWLPREIEEQPEYVALFEKIFTDLEELQLQLAKAFALDVAGVDFNFKKKMTSAMRRVAPIGLATAIGASFNHRALRHVLGMRGTEHAETEIRDVMWQVAKIAKLEWPAIYQDLIMQPEQDGSGFLSFENEKI